MGAFAQHLHLQLASCGREAAAAHPMLPHLPGLWKHMQAEQGFSPPPCAIGQLQAGSCAISSAGLKKQPQPGP